MKGQAEGQDRADQEQAVRTNTGLSFGDGWPTSRSSQNWLHRDCLDVAYIFYFKIYDRMKNDGGLQCPSHYTGPGWIFDLYRAETGDTVAQQNRTQILAEAIPALSTPLGSSESSQLQANRQYNMPQRFADRATWPATRGIDTASDTPFWLHNDLRQIAFLHLARFYTELTRISENNP